MVKTLLLKKNYDFQESGRQVSNCGIHTDRIKKSIFIKLSFGTALGRKHVHKNFLFFLFLTWNEVTRAFDKSQKRGEHKPYEINFFFSLDTQEQKPEKK